MTQFYAFLSFSTMQRVLLLFYLLYHVNGFYDDDGWIGKTSTNPLFYLSFQDIDTQNRSVLRVLLIFPNILDVSGEERPRIVQEVVLKARWKRGEVPIERKKKDLEPNVGVDRRRSAACEFLSSYAKVTELFF